MIGEDAFGDIQNLDVKIYLSQELIDYIACLTNICDETTEYNFVYDPDVKRIPEAFFADVSMSKIVIPDSVEEIGEDAFVGCDYMTELVLGKSLKKLSSTAVPDGADGLEIKIRLNQKLIENMGSFCEIFPDTVSYADISFDSDVTRIPFCFFQYTDIRRMTIPDTVKSIEDEAFLGCSQLKEITIGNGVSYFGLDVFQDCTALRSIYLAKDCPLTVERVSDRLPAGCRVIRLSFICGN